MEDIKLTGHDLIKEYAKKHDEFVNSLTDAYNLKKKWNLIKFNSFTVKEDYYKNNLQVQVHCEFMFCQELIGLHQPKDCLLNLSPNLFKRIASVIKKDEITQWIHLVVYRFDRYDELIEKVKKDRKVKIQSGRIRYLFGVMNEIEFTREFNLMLKRKNFDNFIPYLQQDR